MYRPLRGQVRSHGIGVEPAYQRRCKAIVGAIYQRRRRSNVGAELSANAMRQALEIYRMYRPLRGQVRSHGICVEAIYQRRR